MLHFYLRLPSTPLTFDLTVKIPVINGNNLLTVFLTDFYGENDQHLKIIPSQGHIERI